MMDAERKDLERKQVKPVNLLVLTVLLMVTLIGIQLFYENNQPQPIGNNPIENWHVEWTPKEIPIRSGMATTIQVIIMDENHQWVDNAQLQSEVIQNDEAIELSFYHVEDGLYEAYTTFHSQGLWEGDLTVEQGKHAATYPFQFLVQN